MRSFRSDNASGLCPEALAALIDVNAEGHAPAYGDDAWSTRAADAVRDVLAAPDAFVAFVQTGTAANVLAIAALTDPWEQVLCHPDSHWARHESTAPELFTRCRTHVLTPRGLLLTPDVIPAASPGAPDVHEPQPGVFTLTNISELGLLYGPEELRALADAAHTAGYRLHIDGARFANAVAAAGCEPAALSWRAGADALSFGGTKNGLALGEGVVFFPQGDGHAFERALRRFQFLRKAGAQLLSKSRFLSAPFARCLETGAWLRHAAHANAMGTLLARAVSDAGFAPEVPVHANHVFVRLPPAVDTALRASGHEFYALRGPRHALHRLVCSFDTTPGDVEHFAGVMTRAAG